MFYSQSIVLFINSNYINRHDKSPPPHTAGNWVADGPWMTDRSGYIQTIYQGFGSILEYLARQAPSDVKLQINHDILHQAFTVEDEQGKRITAQPWDLHPSSDPSQIKARQDALSSWEKHTTRMAEFIPHMAVTGEEVISLVAKQGQSKRKRRLLRTSDPDATEIDSRDGAILYLIPINV